jgi:hypothetical protein
VWRDLATQIRTLNGVLLLVERQLQTRMTPEQRNTIYRLMHTYGEAKPGRRFARAGWSSTRFDIATYTDLAAARFDEAVQFDKAHHRALMGSELTSSTQERLL